MQPSPDFAAAAAAEASTRGKFEGQRAAQILEKHGLAIVVYTVATADDSLTMPGFKKLANARRAVRCRLQQAQE